MSNFYLKTKILSEREVDVELEQLNGQRIWIGCDKFLLKNSTVLAITNRLKTNNELLIYSDIVPDPPLEKIAAGVASAATFKPTIMLAIGGGSAIDTAKAVNYFLKEKFALSIHTCYAMPTTSGTGSEVTNIAVVTDTENKVKYPLVDDQIIPDVALLKSELTISCPKSVTAFSGMDVLTHALEALVAKGANSFSDALAEKAADLVFNYLPKCYEEGEHLENRTMMHEASCIAGCAFQNAGLGISHSIAHQIGGQFHMPHGLINSILLPNVVSFNATDAASQSKYARVSRQLKISSWDDGDQKAVQLLVNAIKQLSKRLHCAQSLTEFGIEKERIAEALGSIVTNAKKDFTFGGNPIVPTDEDLLKIILAIV